MAHRNASEIFIIKITDAHQIQLIENKWMETISEKKSTTFGKQFCCGFSPASCIWHWCATSDCSSCLHTKF